MEKYKKVSSTKANKKKRILSYIHCLHFICKLLSRSVKHSLKSREFTLLCRTAALSRINLVNEKQRHGSRKVTFVAVLTIIYCSFETMVLIINR